MKVDETIPIFRNFYIKNLVCEGANRAMEFTGLPEMPIDGVILDNIKIIADNEAIFSYSKNIIKKNVNAFNPKITPFQLCTDSFKFLFFLFYFHRPKNYNYYNIQGILYRGIMHYY